VLLNTEADRTVWNTTLDLDDCHWTLVQSFSWSMRINRLQAKGCIQTMIQTLSFPIHKL